MAISRRSLGFPDQRNRSNHAGRHGGVDAGRYLRHHDVYGQCNVDSLPFDDQGGHTSGNQSLERAGYERNAAHSSRDVTDEPDRRVLFLLAIWINLDNIFSLMPDSYSAGRYVFLFLGLGRVFEMYAGLTG